MRTTPTLAALTLAAGLASAADYDVPGPSGESLKYYLESPLSPIAAGDTLILHDTGSYQTTYTVSDANLTIKAAPGQTIALDGQFAGTVLDVQADNLTLERLTLRGGLAAIDGGAIRCLSHNLTIRDCLFEGNIAPDDGGAIVFSDATLLVEDCNFTGNSTQGSTSESAGGAIQTVRGNITLRRCTFTGNSAVYAGGALHIADTDARYCIEDCAFSDNTANFGGAVWWTSAAEGDVFDSTFDANTAAIDGGAVYHNSAPATYTRCVFTHNKTEGPNADDAGAVYVHGETTNEVELYSCLLAHNTAASNGGALVFDTGPDSKLYNCTVADNTALGANSAVGGGAAFTLGNGATPFFRNCIVRGNAPDQFAGPTNLQHSNVEGGAGTGVIDADPLFLNPATLDYRLADASPSIDAGDTSWYAAAPAPTDLDANPRAVTASASPAGTPLLGLYVDQGAYEFQPATVSSCPGDADGNGILNLDDINVFANSFLSGCP